MSETEIRAALTEVNSGRCEPPLSRSVVARIAKSVAGYVPEDEEEDEAGRSVVQVRQKLTTVTDRALKALRKRPDLRIFVRGRMLVTVGRDGSNQDRWLRRTPGSPVIIPIEKPLMLALLDEAAAWKKWDGRAKELRPALPPDWVAVQVLARLTWRFPYLEGITETPTLRPDGSVLDRPGWDEESGILFEPIPGVIWPSVAEHPSLPEVEAALAELLDPVQDFPFVAGSDKAAYVGAILTILGRRMIDGPAPLFVVRSPSPGTGKGLLSQVAGIAGTGRTPAAMTLSYEGEELRKRITALAVAGTPLVLLDNLSGSLGSDALAAALTATSWEDRILGATQMVRVPLRLVWFATGNNLGFRRTLGRRVVPIDLDAKVEQPEDRTGFRYPSLVAHVHEQRSRLVTAGLTILRGFHTAGRPGHGGPRMGSFEAWDDLVRSAVIWAGMEDPAGTDDPTSARGRIRSQADDDNERYGALLESLARVSGEGVPFSASAVISKASSDDDLRAALDAAASPRRGGHATAASLGAALRELRDRPVEGLVLRRHSRTWSVERTRCEE